MSYTRIKAALRSSCENGQTYVTNELQVILLDVEILVHSGEVI